jgi:hypothetical protein
LTAQRPLSHSRLRHAAATRTTAHPHFTSSQPPPDPPRHSPTNIPARRKPSMPPNGASDPTTAPEQMLEVRALLVSCITEGAIGVHRSSRSKAFEERCAPEVTTLKRCPVHTNPLDQGANPRGRPREGQAVAQEALMRRHNSETGQSKPAGSRKTASQRLRWSEAASWAWLDLNQRPHPYQLPRRNLDAGLIARRLGRSGAVRISSYFRSL